jgi:excisionase family DNA binding protein
MEITTTSQDKLISLKGTAQRLDLSVRAVYRLIASGTLPRPVKVGGATKFFESDLKNYLDSLKTRRG